MSCVILAGTGTNGAYFEKAEKIIRYSLHTCHAQIVKFNFFHE